MTIVVTKDVTNITTNSASCGGNVTDDGNGTVTARGICWSEIHNPNIDNIYCEVTTDGTGTGTFTSQLTNLKENTTYYVRSYATNEKGTSYGEERIFKTESLINGYDWVDLGLPSGLKWATCNVGANNPEDYGNYYAWGETTISAYNCLTNGLSISELQSQGIIDEDYNLTPSYDAATANWGGTWRLPTKAEMEELKNNCTWEWTVQGGKNGYKVTGPNGNNIFLPAAGRHIGSSLQNAGELEAIGVLRRTRAMAMVRTTFASIAVFRTWIGTIATTVDQSVRSQNRSVGTRYATSLHASDSFDSFRRANVETHQ